MSAVFKATSLGVDLLLTTVGGCSACADLGERCQDCDYEHRQAAEIRCPFGDETCEHRKYDADMCDECAADCGYDKQLEIEL